MERCCVCNKITETALHHIHPIQYGGDEEGPQVQICADCHNKVHFMANALTSKKGAKTNLFVNDEDFQRAIPLIQAIINAKTWFDSQPQSNKPRRRMFTLQIGDADFVKLHKRKMDCGFTSLNKFIQALIQKEINEVK